MKRSPVAVTAAIVLASLALTPQSPPRLVPGDLPGGARQLTNGWRVNPAGAQVSLGPMPMSSVVSPDGKYLIVLSSGADSPSLTVLEEATLKEITRSSVPGAWLGLAMNKAGDRIYVGGGAQAAVFEFAFKQGVLAPTRRIDLADPAQRHGDDFAGDVALSTDGKRLFVAQLLRDGIDVVNLATGRVDDRFGTGRRPYRIMPHPNGEFLYVSSWADGAIYRHRTARGELLDKLTLAPHTTDMLLVPGEPPREEGNDTDAAARRFAARIFVTAGNTNNVYVLGVEENGALEAAGAIHLTLTPRQPAGMTPSALAYDAARRWLYVACSDANAVGAVDVSIAHPNVLGFIPAGEYPLGVRVLSNGRLLTLNAPGSGSVAAGLDAEKLIRLTRDVLNNSPYRDERLINAGVPAGSPIPNVPGEASPIKHVVYVLRGGSSYDETLGDLPHGKGDRALTVFGETVTPNIHKLAREYTLFDNFYMNGARYAESLAWASAAIAPDFIRKLPPGLAAGADAAATPPGGYLWTNAALAGVSIRNYAWREEERLPRRAGGAPAARVKDPILDKASSATYHALDPSAGDSDRVKIITEELDRYEKAGNLPQLLLIRLGDGQPALPTRGREASRQRAAESDLALGLLVESISKSRFWSNTAIVVLGINGGNGRDHVHPQRSTVLVISPYARRGAVDSNFYNTTSALRTMELILGLRPMTQFDAGSFPMWTAFQAQPDARPYTHEPVRLSSISPFSSPKIP